MKVDGNFLPSLVSSVDSEEDEIYATINGTYTADSIIPSSPQKGRTATISTPMTSSSIPVKVKSFRQPSLLLL
ncbi:hypothetical protein M1146_05510, partial [Patescibacteria group bacterium]|nr:hypothetical protein [Patescibacteria group bacterium]